MTQPDTKYPWKIPHGFTYGWSFTTLGARYQLVKLLGAGAIAVPPGDVLTFITVMAIAGSLLAMIYLIGRAMPAPHPTNRPASLLARALRIERRRLHRGGPLPYACAIAVGGLFVLI